MSDFVVRLIVNAVALVAAVELIPGVELDWRGSPLTLLIVALIFGVINSYLKPIVRILSLPVVLLTLGLVGFVINAAMLLLLAFVSGELDLGFSLAGWPAGPFGIDVLVTAFLAALLISVVSTILSLVQSSRRLIGL